MNENDQDMMRRIAAVLVKALSGGALTGADALLLANYTQGVSSQVIHLTERLQVAGEKLKQFAECDPVLTEFVGLVASDECSGWDYKNGSMYVQLATRRIETTGVNLKECAREALSLHKRARAVGVN